MSAKLNLLIPFCVVANRRRNIFNLFWTIGKKCVEMEWEYSDEVHETDS